MYYDKDCHDYLVRQTTYQPPQAWTELQAVRKKQLESRINNVERLLEKTEAKLQLTKKRLRAATKSLADCQMQLILRERQACVCKIKVLKVPVR
jgi:septal ring factor EnvC (AmiA/AmiB activator)